MGQAGPGPVDKSEGFGGPGRPRPVDKSEGFGEGRAGPGPANRSEGFWGNGPRAGRPTLFGKPSFDFKVGVWDLVARGYFIPVRTSQKGRWSGSDVSVSHVARPGLSWTQLSHL